MSYLYSRFGPYYYSKIIYNNNAVNGIIQCGNSNVAQVLCNGNLVYKRYYEETWETSNNHTVTIGISYYVYKSQNSDAGWAGGRWNIKSISIYPSYPKDYYFYVNTIYPEYSFSGKITVHPFVLRAGHNQETYSESFSVDYSDGKGGHSSSGSFVYSITDGSGHTFYNINSGDINNSSIVGTLKNYSPSATIYSTTYETRYNVTGDVLSIIDPELPK